MVFVFSTTQIIKHAVGEKGPGSSAQTESSPRADTRTDSGTGAPPGIDPSREERVEALAILRQRLVENAKASLLNSHQYAPANHPCVQELSETVRWAAEQLKLPPDSVSLHVFKHYPSTELRNCSDAISLGAYLPQAFVLSDCGAIFINVAALEALSWSRQMIHAVLYHEVAHVQLKRDLRTQVELDILDPLAVQMETYEIEHHCDRLAALLSSLRKEDPKSIAQALVKLAEEEERIFKASDCTTDNLNHLQIPLLMTHPATARRIRENAAITEHLPTTGLIADSKLAPIEDSHLPINRPLGGLIDEMNSLGISSDEVWVEGSDELPMEFTELISQGQEILRVEGLEAQSQLYSDWFANFCAFLRTEDGPQFKQEYADELRGPSNSGEGAKDALGTVLENINFARILPNRELCSVDSALDLIFHYGQGQVDYPREVLDLLVARYAEFRDEHTRPFDVLADLVEIGERGDRRFGIGSVFFSTALVRLCAEVAHSGSEQEQLALVALVDRNPCLRTVLDTCSKTTALSDEVPNCDSLSKLLRAHSKTMFRSLRQTSLGTSLEAHTLERWIGPPLSSRELCELPICVRREPGAPFSVERKTLRSGREYELVIVGDTQVGDSERALLRQHLTESIDRGLQEVSSRLKLSATELADNRAALIKSLAEKVSYIEQTGESLGFHTPKTTDEKRAYVNKLLAVEFEEAIDNRTHRVIDGVHSLSSDDSIDTQLHLNLGFRIRIEGTDAVWDDLVGTNRGSFSQARYAQVEERSPQHVQHERLWHELYGAEYASVDPGLDKTRFLIESYPIKTRYRDQLICESLDLPPLRYLDDMGSLSEAMQSETSVDTLVLLRDSLHSQELAQVAEVRLFELFEKNPEEFLGHPRIVASLTDVLKPLPDVLQRLVGSDERLLGVLVCFAYASRERDLHLVPFRDGANNREEKEALGALFSDPNLASTQGVVLFQRRQDADTVFASMAAVEPYDKAQALLYFMGRRGFFSPIGNSFESGRFSNSWVGDRNTPLIPRKSAPGVRIPDALIRAQKAFGIRIDTAENLKAGLLNERTLTELLRETLYGRNGVASEPDLLRKFFTLAGRTLIQQNPQLAALETEQKKKLAEFLGFAFATCPENRLPSVILKVWEASKGDNKDAPALVATIFSKLGSTFVKFGQRLAQLDIDAQYKHAFRKLCSENAKVDTSFVYHNLSITSPPGTFDELRTGRKIAEGSMAATFEGTLRDSEKRVCIKMIHPSIRGHIDQDVDYIRKIVEYMNREQTFAGLTIPANTPEIVRQQLTEQVDTRLEIDRTEHLRNALQDPKSASVTFVVPEVLHDVSGEGVIVYEFLPSYELDKEQIRSQGFDAQAISHEVGLEILRMLVEEKHYQSDVNLGNFGVLKDPESGAIVCTKNHRPTVVWYDAGAVQEIAPEDQKLLLRIVYAAARNPAEIPGLVSTLVHAEGASAKQVHTICQEFGERLKGSGKLELTRLQEQLQEFIDALAEAGFTVQDKWLVIANTLSMAAPLLRGVDEGRLTDLFTKAMQKHKLISTGELLAMRFVSLWK